MIEHHVDIATADGAMNCFVVHPEEGVKRTRNLVSVC